MRCARIKPDRPDSSKFTKRRQAGPRAAARCNLMETERNTAANQLAPLPFTFGRPLSCLRRDNCQRWTCFINADTLARTKLCERGIPTVARIRLLCNTSSPRCGSWTYLSVAAELNEFVYSFMLELYFLFRTFCPLIYYPVYSLQKKHKIWKSTKGQYAVFKLALERYLNKFRIDFQISNIFDDKQYECFNLQKYFKNQFACKRISLSFIYFYPRSYHAFSVILWITLRSVCAVLADSSKRLMTYARNKTLVVSLNDNIPRDALW